MERFYVVSVGTLLTLALALVACNRSEKTPKPGVAASGPVAPSLAPAAPAGNPAAGMPVSGVERTFLDEATTDGLFEIEASRFIAGHTTDNALKSYAQQMEREHSSANDELKRIASGKGIALPMTLGFDAQAALAKLKTLPAAQRDHAFVEDFGIAAHRKTIALFESQATGGRDPELQAFAERTLPTLREHLGMAQQLQGKAVGG